jgi:hypothetical protein
MAGIEMIRTISCLKPEVIQVFAAPTLTEAGIDKKLSSRAQKANLDNAPEHANFWFGKQLYGD